MNKQNVQINFIEILCCPNRLCRGDLIEIEKERNHSLFCTLCETEYEIINGIPILFPNARFSHGIHERHWNLEKNADSYSEKYNSYLRKQGSPWGLYTHTSELEAIKKLTKKIDLKNKYMLDCGCGNGRLLTTYQEASIKIGIDASLQMLLNTKKREPSLILVCGQIEDMPFKDCIVDFSVSIRVLQHIKYPENAFSEMVRVTKPTGFIALELYNKINLKNVYKNFRMSEFIGKKNTWGLSFDKYYSFKDIENWSKETFVTPIKWVGAGWGIFHYLFNIIKFRYYAPNWFQKIVYFLSLNLERLVSELPFFSMTMEKICFIGSIQYFSKMSLYKRIISFSKRIQDETIINKFADKLKNRNYCYIGNDLQHLRLTIDWMKRAQDATPDGGVSRGYSLVRNTKFDIGWQPSYPETTGYIIPTIIECSKFINDDNLSHRASLMANWIIQIMAKDGFIQGGNIKTPAKPVIFNTGQIIRGLLAIYNETNQEKYLEAAIRAANWIIQHEYNLEGKWINNNATCVNQMSTGYNVYAIAPIVKLGKKIGQSKFLEIGKRVGDYTCRLQNEYGWYENCDFRNEKDNLLHTIAYTMDGLWEIGELLSENKFTNSSKWALDSLIDNNLKDGVFGGRIDREWKSTVDWICLTGLAQIGVLCMKLFKKNNNAIYKECATTLKDFLKAHQNNLDDNFSGGKGAVWGSWPINSPYGRYQALNWPAKYFADLLLYFLDNQQLPNPSLTITPIFNTKTLQNRSKTAII